MFRNGTALEFLFTHGPNTFFYNKIRLYPSLILSLCGQRKPPENQNSENALKSTYIAQSWENLDYKMS